MPSHAKERSKASRVLSYPWSGLFNLLVMKKSERGRPDSVHDSTDHILVMVAGGGVDMAKTHLDGAPQSILPHLVVGNHIGPIPQARYLDAVGQDIAIVLAREANRGQDPACGDETPQKPSLLSIPRHPLK